MDESGIFENFPRLPIQVAQFLTGSFFNEGLKIEYAGHLVCTWIDSSYFFQPTLE